MNEQSSRLLAIHNTNKTPIRANTSLNNKPIFVLDGVKATLPILITAKNLTKVRDKSAASGF